tara:strand:+ start:4878 stop:5345 length:468 start_codon:yes stop_codon:yes gene_type:complete
MTSIFQQLNKYDPHFVGFDRLFNRLNAFELNPTSGGNYPPYNIIRDGDNYTIELAVAGFNDDEIEVVHEPEQGRLVVTGSNDREGVDYLHQGIASRTFNRSWNVSDTIVISGADLSDGILRIELENVVPDEKKPKVISIGKGGKIAKSKKELLTE